MATIKIELMKSKTLKLEGDRHPIFIVVRHNNIARRKLIGNAFVTEWDEVNKKIKPKGRKDHITATIHIENEFDKYKQIFNKLKNSGDKWTADDVFNYEDKPKGNSHYFFEAAASFLSTIDKSSWTYDTARAKVEKIRRYAPDDLLISEIDDEWLAGFITHCQTKEKSSSGEIGNSKNTINYAIKFIKRVVSFLGMENPALKRKKLAKTKTLKRKLTIDEINLLADAELTPGTIRYHARNIFLVQFYLRGMRIGDALKLRIEFIQNERLIYTANKTEVVYDMKIVKPCMAILNECIGKRKSGYVFPLLRGKLSDDQLKSEIKNRTGVINRHLKEIAKTVGITKNISTHIARHSFGSIADKTLGGNLKTLQGLFGHSSRAMTEGYINDLRATDDLDDAADKIF